MLPRLVSAVDPLAELAAVRGGHRRVRSGEVLGSAVAINLLFPSIPLLWAVLITALDVLLLLALQGLGMRMIEAVVALFVATIGLCYCIEIFVIPQTHPSFGEWAARLCIQASATRKCLPWRSA